LILESVFSSNVEFVEFVESEYIL